MKNKFDVIFCRNVLYYFSPEAKAELFKRFYEILNPQGCVLISVSDSHSVNDKLFKKVTNGVFKRD